ncbi:unnamed protein product [Nezara viridula]|uniref:Uncharacterized protein n=1 Tax=Nezara viridula TaxID=85310 RepID=A0A9P0H7D9_NEZVI|nr:unnamed protein product [Nezara viridula]
MPRKFNRYEKRQRPSDDFDFLSSSSGSESDSDPETDFVKEIRKQISDVVERLDINDFLLESDSGIEDCTTDDEEFAKMKRKIFERLLMLSKRASRLPHRRPL